MFWYRVYALAVAVLYGGGIAALAIFVRAPLWAIALFGALSAFFAAAAFVPYKPWGWTVAFAAILVGLTGYALPLAVPLLFLWNRPLVKAAFGRM